MNSKLDQMLGQRHSGPKHDTLTQCWCNVGPMSLVVARHYTNTRSLFVSCLLYGCLTITCVHWSLDKYWTRNVFIENGRKPVPFSPQGKLKPIIN